MKFIISAEDPEELQIVSDMLAKLACKRGYKYKTDDGRAKTLADIMDLVTANVEIFSQEDFMLLLQEYGLKKIKDLGGRSDLYAEVYERVSDIQKLRSLI